MSLAFKKRGRGRGGERQREKSALQFVHCSKEAPRWVWPLCSLLSAHGAWPSVWFKTRLLTSPPETLSPPRETSESLKKVLRTHINIHPSPQRCFNTLGVKRFFIFLGLILQRSKWLFFLHPHSRVWVASLSFKWWQSKHSAHPNNPDSTAGKTNR